MSTLTISKTEFKPKAFEYLRRVEQGDQVCITDHGCPVVDIVPHSAEDERELSELRRLPLKYDRPLDSVDVVWAADA